VIITTSSARQNPYIPAYCTYMMQGTPEDFGHKCLGRGTVSAEYRSHGDESAAAI
jgi:hypothetical protein